MKFHETKNGKKIKPFCQTRNRFGVPFNVAEYVNRFLRIKNQT